MKKIKFNYENIDKKVKIYLEESLTELKKASNLSQSMYVPYGFQYHSYLVNLKSEIEEIKNDLNDLNNWLSDSNTKLNRAVYDIESDLEKVEELKILKNNNFVNIVSTVKEDN